MRSKRKTAADAVGLAGALREPEPALPYRVVHRWADAWAGRRDGRADARVLVDEPAAGGGEVPLCARVWLSRNAHTFAERDRREFLAAQAAAAPLVARLWALTTAAALASAAAQAAAARRAGMSPEPSGEELARRGPGEVHDTDRAVAARRRTAHQRALAQADAAVATAQQQARALAEQASQVRSDLESLFQVTRTRSERLREYHQRRATTFRRAHRRKLTRRLGAGYLAPELADIPVPAWTTGSCPWTAEIAPTLTEAA